MARANPENEIIRDALDLLFRNGILCWRHNNTKGHKADFGHYRGYVRGPWSYSEETGVINLKGTTDIIALLPPEGRFLGLEGKVKGKRLDPEQRKFRKAVERSGGLYLVFNNNDDIVRFLRSLGFNVR
jgi:hypothetical protein